ncbi:unnamed protein product, partial [Closterium sp. NIES-53]
MNIPVHPAPGGFELTRSPSWWKPELTRSPSWELHARGSSPPALWSPPLPPPPPCPALARETLRSPIRGRGPNPSAPKRIRPIGAVSDGL